jgi:hypothetical protein
MPWQIWPDLPAWLTVSPVAGYLAPGQSVLLEVGGDDTGLEPGHHGQDLRLVTGGGLGRVAVRLTTCLQVVESTV